jgi:chromosome partitioning protein
MNSNLNIEGVLLTMFDARTKLDNEVSIEVRKFFKERVYDVAIPQSVKIPVAQSKGKPITFYDKGCSAAKAYSQLAIEILKKHESTN